MGENSGLYCRKTFHNVFRPGSPGGLAHASHFRIFRSKMTVTKKRLYFVNTESVFSPSHQRHAFPHIRGMLLRISCVILSAILCSDSSTCHFPGVFSCGALWRTAHVIEGGGGVLFSGGRGRGAAATFHLSLTCGPHDAGSLRNSFSEKRSAI